MTPELLLEIAQDAVFLFASCAWYPLAAVILMDYLERKS